MNSKSLATLRCERVGLIGQRLCKCEGAGPALVASCRSRVKGKSLRVVCTADCKAAGETHAKRVAQKALEGERRRVEHLARCSTLFLSASRAYRWETFLDPQMFQRRVSFP